MSKPTIFVGSSTEGLPIARIVQEQLQHDAEVTLWSDAVFPLGRANLEALLELANRFDFAALVLTPDDRSIVRGHELSTPRDNVIFELGLFMGMLGRDRTFAICSRTLPVWSDLAGITIALYDGDRTDLNLMAALGPACNQVRRAIAREGVGRRKQLTPPFWRPFLGESSVLVIGHFAMPHFEGSGLVGLGDAMALIEVQGYADKFAAPHPVVRDARGLGPDDRGKNLIVLGGPDVNRLTAQLLERLNCPFDAGVSSVRDRLKDATYTPEHKGSVLAKDIGLIVEAANPFDQEKRVLLMFGCYGYGTWAAARFAKTSSFLDSIPIASGHGVECVVQAEIVENVPYVITAVLLREQSVMMQRKPV